MRVPVGRFLRTGELHGAFEVLDRCMKIGPAHQGTSEGEVGLAAALEACPISSASARASRARRSSARHLRLRAR